MRRRAQSRMMLGAPRSEKATMKANVGTYATMPTFSISESTARAVPDLQSAGTYRHCAVTSWLPNLGR